MSVQVLAREGLAVPRTCREPGDYARFFQSLGLEEGRRPRKPGERGLVVSTATSNLLTCLRVRPAGSSNQQHLTQVSNGHSWVWEHPSCKVVAGYFLPDSRSWFASKLLQAALE